MPNNKEVFVKTLSRDRVRRRRNISYLLPLVLSASCPLGCEAPGPQPDASVLLDASVRPDAGVDADRDAPPAFEAPSRLAGRVELRLSELEAPLDLVASPHAPGEELVALLTNLQEPRAASALQVVRYRDRVPELGPRLDLGIRAEQLDLLEEGTRRWLLAKQAGAAVRVAWASDGSFGELETIALDPAPSALALVDADGDDDLDALSTDADGAVHLHRRDASGFVHLAEVALLPEGHDTPLATVVLPFAPGRVAIGFSSFRPPEPDGTQFEQTEVVVLALGETLSIAQRIPIAGGPLTRGVAADFDGDGDDDVAIAGVNLLAITLHENDAGSLSDSTLLWDLTPSPFRVCAADLDRDGAWELLAADSTGANTAIFSHLEGALLSSVAASRTSSVASATTALVRAGGEHAWVLGDGAAHTLSFLEGTFSEGRAAHEDTRDFRQLTAPSGLAVVDLEGDGSFAVALSDSVEAGIELWAASGGAPARVGTVLEGRQVFAMAASRDGRVLAAQALSPGEIVRVDAEGAEVVASLEALAQDLAVVEVGGSSRALAGLYQDSDGTWFVLVHDLAPGSGGERLRFPIEAEAILASPSLAVGDVDDDGSDEILWIERGDIRVLEPSSAEARPAPLEGAPMFGWRAETLAVLRRPGPDLVVVGTRDDEQGAVVDLLEVRDRRGTVLRRGSVGGRLAGAVDIERDGVDELFTLDALSVVDVDRATGFTTRLRGGVPDAAFRFGTLDLTGDRVGDVVVLGSISGIGTSVSRAWVMSGVR
jgi:hypothetical protein